MYAKIALLSDEVVNQIAAGEVIENPASVIKELVDNAIDAGAKSIEIEIEAGGQESIRVEDDGVGMSRSDLELSLLRHATSKIKTLSDLESLYTMGFRGEALAAIASISKVRIRTSNGVEVTERTPAHEFQSCARNRGTTVNVESLFYNTPARRKFQKSQQANSQQIVRVVESLALSHPDIAFVLRSQGKTLVAVEAGDWKKRILDIQGEEFVDGGIWLEGDEHFQGLLCHPQMAKTTRHGQRFFLNRRPIFSPLLSKAVLEGYGTRIAIGHHPLCILFLSKDPTEFDVNVHPQKREVRFSNEARLFCEVKGTVERAFLPKTLQESLGASFSPPDLSAFSHAWRGEEIERPFIQEKLWEEDHRGQAMAVIGLFLLIQREGTLFFVDLRGALETEARTSMAPLELSLSPLEEERLEEWIERLKEVGVEARATSKKSMIVEIIPKWLDPSEVENFFEELKKGRGEERKQYMRKSISLEEAEYLWKKSKQAKEIPIDSLDLERILARKS
jgi:DNA mismatch repair protein MutL